LDTPHPSALKGQTLQGQYKIEALVGEGGSAFVYRASHQILQSTVAIKVLKKSGQQHPTLRERFFREARAQNQQEHPNIVKVIGFIDEDGLTGCIQEWCNDGELEEKLQANPGPMPYTHIKEQFLPLLGAFTYIHELGWVHRDVKPSNILLHTTRDTQVWKLNDFGLLKDPSANELTELGVYMGTPSYSSPEQHNTSEQIDFRSDIFGLGVILYRLLTGELPFKSTNNIRLALQISNDPFPVPRGIPKGLLDVLTLALAKSPENRFPDTKAFQTALANALENAIHSGDDLDKRKPLKNSSHKGFIPQRTVITGPYPTIIPDEKAPSSEAIQKSKASEKRPTELPKVTISSGFQPGPTETTSPIQENGPPVVNSPVLEESSPPVEKSSKKRLYGFIALLCMSITLGIGGYTFFKPPAKKAQKDSHIDLSKELEKRKKEYRQQSFLTIAITSAQKGIWGTTRYGLRLACFRKTKGGCFHYASFVHQTLQALKDACKQGDKTGCFWDKVAKKRGYTIMRYIKRAIPLYQRACRERDGKGCTALAKLYLKAIPNPKKATKYFERGCSLPEGHSCLEWSKWLLSRPNTHKYKQKIDALLERACNTFHTEGCILLGKRLWVRASQKEEFTKIRQVFRLACQNADQRGCILMKQLSSIQGTKALKGQK